MAPVVADSTSNSVGTKKKTLGRRKVQMKKVEALNHRQLVTFCKRKKGLFQKAEQLNSLTGTDIAVLVVSECGNVFGFGSPSCDAVADRYLAGLSPTQTANYQNHGISSQDDIRSMIVESNPSSSSDYSQNENVHYQNNGALVGSMMVETPPSNGFPIRVLEDNILGDGNLDLATNDTAMVGSMIVETTPSSHSNFFQSDGGVVVGSKIVETTPSTSSCSELRVSENDILSDGYLNLMNDTVSPADPYEYQEGNNGGPEAGEMTGQMIEEMIEELMKEDEEVPGCNEFLTHLVKVLLPSTTSKFFTSLLVMEDQDELLMDNRGLGTCYFNPYEDWRCEGIYH